VIAVIAALVAGAAGFLLGRRRAAAREEELSDARRRLAEADRRLSQREQEFKTLKEVTDVISEHPGQPGILAAIVSMVAKSLEADVCAFLLLDEAAGELVIQPGAYGASDEEGPGSRIPLSNEASSSVRVFLEAKPFFTGDAQADPRVLGAYARRWKLHSLLVAPLTVEGRKLGVLRVGSRRRDFFTEEHLRLVALIAEEAAVLVEGAMMSQKLADMSLEMARLTTLKDEFVSTVSHEFKTPLTSIKGFLSILLDEQAGPISESQRRFLTIVRDAAERLGLLVSDILDISRLEGGVKFERAPLRLDELARRCVEGHAWAAEQKKVRLELRQPLPEAVVDGDAQWLGHVFDNLVSNALKFTPDGGKVTVSVAQDHGWARVEVSDSGVGIPSEDQPRIFDKFYRANNRSMIKAPGTGLGLAICKSVIDKHEGRLWVESSPGKGSKFFFEVAAQAAALTEGIKS